MVPTEDDLRRIINSNEGRGISILVRSWVVQHLEWENAVGMCCEIQKEARKSHHLTRGYSGWWL